MDLLAVLLLLKYDVKMRQSFVLYLHDLHDFMRFFRFTYVSHVWNRILFVFYVSRCCLKANFAQILMGRDMGRVSTTD